MFAFSPKACDVHNFLNQLLCPNQHLILKFDNTDCSLNYFWFQKAIPRIENTQNQRCHFPSMWCVLPPPPLYVLMDLPLPLLFFTFPPP